MTLRIDLRSTGYLRRLAVPQIQAGMADIRGVASQHQHTHDTQEEGRALERNLRSESAGRVLKIEMKLTTFASNKDIPTLLNATMA